jgi:hypothetical protein
MTLVIDDNDNLTKRLQMNTVVSFTNKMQDMTLAHTLSYFDEALMHTDANYNVQLCHWDAAGCAVLSSAYRFSFEVTDFVIPLKLGFLAVVETDFTAANVNLSYDIADRSFDGFIKLTAQHQSGINHENWERVAHEFHLNIYGRDLLAIGAFGAIVLDWDELLLWTDGFANDGTSGEPTDIQLPEKMPLADDQYTRFTGRIDVRQVS